MGEMQEIYRRFRESAKENSSDSSFLCLAEMYKGIHDFISPFSPMEARFLPSILRIVSDQIEEIAGEPMPEEVFQNLKDVFSVGTNFVKVLIPKEGSDENG